jgi:nitrogen fixation protein
MALGKGVIVKLKEYECVEVKRHKDVGGTITEWQKNGWRLHTYQAVGDVGMATAFVNHYLLFEKGE